MKKCKSKWIGLGVIIFGVSLLLAIFMPLKFLIFILIFLIIYVGYIIFKIG